MKDKKELENLLDLIIADDEPAATEAFWKMYKRRNDEALGPFWASINNFFYNPDGSYK